MEEKKVISNAPVFYMVWRWEISPETKGFIHSSAGLFLNVYTEVYCSLSRALINRFKINILFLRDMCSLPVFLVPNAFGIFLL